MAYPVDPYAPEDAVPPIGPWTGTWPPHPSWDAPATVPVPPAPPSAAPDDGSPVPPGPYPGPPVDENAPAPPAPALPQEPPDAALITMGDDSAPPPPAVHLGFPHPPGAPEPLDPALSYLPETSELGAPAQGNAMPGQPPPPDAADIELEPGTPPAQPEEPVLTDDERVAGLQRIAETDPVQFADILQQHEDARLHEDAARRLKAAKDDADRAQQAWQTHQDAQAAARQRSADLDAESDRLANEKVDPDGWRNSRSLFQTIAMYVTGIVGGLVASRTGGPNQGLAMIDNEIQRHIAAQQANLAHRRALLGDRRQSLADQSAQEEHDYMQGEAFRQAAYKRTLDAIDADMQNYDPNGTAWLRRASLRAQVDGQLQQSRQAAVEKAYQQSTAQMKFVAEMRKADDEHAAAMRKLAGIGAGGGAQPPQFYAAQGLPPPPMAMSGKDYDEWLKRQKDVGEIGAGRANASRAQQEMDIKSRDLIISGPQGVLKKKDGSDYLAPSMAAEDTRAKMHAAKQVTDMIDEVLAIRDRVGGESAAFNSDDFQRLKALQNQITIMQKSGTQGMSSDEDMQKLADAVGAADVTSFRARAAGLKEGRKLTVKRMNDWLHDHNYDGPPVKFTNLSAKPKATKEDRKEEQLIKSTTGEKKQSIPTAAIISPAGAMARGVEFLARSENTKLPDGAEKDQIDHWVSVAFYSGDAEKRKAAAARLANLSRSKSPAVRAYAAQAAMRAHVLSTSQDDPNRYNVLADPLDTARGPQPDEDEE